MRNNFSQANQNEQLLAEEDKYMYAIKEVKITRVEAEVGFLLD